MARVIEQGISVFELRRSRVVERGGGSRVDKRGGGRVVAYPSGPGLQQVWISNCSMVGPPLMPYNTTLIHTLKCNILSHWKGGFPLSLYLFTGVIEYSKHV